MILMPRSLPRLTIVITLFVITFFLVKDLRIVRIPGVWDENNHHHRTTNANCFIHTPRFKNDIQVVLKTGAAENPAKLKAHLETVTSCVPNLLIFSDKPGQVEGHQVIDILADLPDSYLNDSDFSAYRSQGHTANSEPSWAGWKLDRLKWLPMIERAYKEHPRMSWYVILEPDTWVFWDSLIPFLDRLDPLEQLYIGSPLLGTGDVYFAQGGSGVVLSLGAMQRLFPRAGREVGFSERHSHIAMDECCGDVVLGHALAEEGIPLAGYWPSFNGANLDTLALGGNNTCVPLITLHHMNPEQLERLWQWQGIRTSQLHASGPVLHTNMFDLIHSPYKSHRKNWNNLSAQRATDPPAHRSANACRQHCESLKDCLQYYHQKAVGCFVDDQVRLGMSVPEEADPHVSGWMFDDKKIFEFARKPCPRDAETVWLERSLERHLVG